MVILLQFPLINVLSCDCKTISKEDESTMAHSIIIGNVVSVKDSEGFFTVNVDEVFKGEEPEILNISFKNACSIYPQLGEKWLLYLVKENDELYASQCGWSRSYSWPFKSGGIGFPEPPSININEDLLPILHRINKDLATLELRMDVNHLRRLKKDLDLIKYRELKNSVDSLTRTLNFICWGIVVSIILIGLLLIKIFY